MRIASFNVESLFDRAKALNTESWAEGRPVLEAYAEANKLLNEPVYTPEIKTRLVALLIDLGLEKEDQPRGGFALLRQNRGHLVKRTKVGNDTKLEIVADGREDWIGWIELTKEPTDELATEHTAMVMRDVNADVLGVVEADNRTALQLFSELLLKKVNGKPYEHVMLIDGNDDRGIDVGILTGKGYDILSVTSHVDDTLSGKRIFSRDCPVYTIKTKKGNRLVVLVNHLKSKGYDHRRSPPTCARSKPARSPRSTASSSTRVRQTSLSSATSTTSPAHHHSSHYSQTRTSRTSRSTHRSPATDSRAPLDAGTPKRSSTTSSSHRSSSRKSQAARSSARASGARTRTHPRSGRSTPPSLRPYRPLRITPPSTPTSTSEQERTRDARSSLRDTVSRT